VPTVIRLVTTIRSLRTAIVWWIVIVPMEFVTRSFWPCHLALASLSGADWARFGGWELQDDVTLPLALIRGARGAGRPTALDKSPSTATAEARLLAGSRCDRFSTYHRLPI
jgi:hypothetical protein